MMITSRNAACCALATSDCHIKNYSPPIVMNPVNHNKKPSINPKIGMRLA